jgi:hypothetical protein
MIASNTHGQSISSNKTENRIQIELYYSYNQNLSSENIDFSREIGFHNDYDRFNFTTGLNVVYFLNNNFALYSGMSYANRSFTGLFYCNACNFVGSGPQREKANLKFIQFPVALRIYPYNNKIGIFGELGIINQIMFGFNKLNTYGATDQLKGNTYSLSGMIGAGVVYNFSPEFSAQLSVKYTNGLSNIFANADYNYRILGVQLGIKRKL